MTHDELLLLVSDSFEKPLKKAIISIVELHKPSEIADAYGDIGCVECDYNADYKIWNQPYPCPTIQAIEEQIK